MTDKFFPRPKRPQIYVYSVPGQPGYKVGYTARVVKGGKDTDACHKRIREGLVKTPNPQYKLEWYEPAVTKSGRFFTDKEVHKWIVNFDEKSAVGGEFYDVSLDLIKSVIHGIKEERPESGNDLRQDFKMRPEQERIVLEETAPYFRQHQAEGEVPHYLWNCKMRFGKTFASYQLAKAMGWRRILVLTYKPSVEGEWKKDLYGHKDFEGWQFIEGRSGWDETEIDESRPVVWFASYQDVLGTNAEGNLKARHKKMREVEWDCVYVDEYHFGAWRDAAKEFGKEDKKEERAPEDLDEASEIEETLPLTAHGYLYLSGTPFRALAVGEFTEDQISNWTYADEQRAKREWTGENNPYAELPKIVMLTYQMPESLRAVANGGEFNEFDLNKFFTTEKVDGEDRFAREKDVQKFLNILRGVDLQVAVEDRMDYRKPALPFEDARLLPSLRHTLWFLPDVAACKAMERMLKNDQFFGTYTVIRAAGSDTPGGNKARGPVDKAIGEGTNTRTITLSCGKLITGVTVPAWGGVLFLRNTKFPETYFQTAFRAQSPWALKDVADPKQKVILKPTCYILDFAPNRALKLISDYSVSLACAAERKRPEELVREFTEFLPVLCFNGIYMQEMKAEDILNVATFGTTSTMLAKRWQAAKLVDTTTVVLEKILNNAEMMAALEKIEDFRTLRGDLTQVITREKSVHESKKERAEEGRSATAEETAEEKAEKKERQDFKEKLRKKLLKFIARVPVFMYLTDYREESLIDVIRNLEPELFTKVTGLQVKDFDMMCEIGVFNQTELNAAIASFRRFEDASLEYAGGRAAHDDQEIGLFDTKIRHDELDEIIEAESGGFQLGV